eukprot:tig00000123_g6933.t1
MGHHSRSSCTACLYMWTRQRAPKTAPAPSAARRDGLLAQKRVVRIFVSSTFQDMQAERDAIRSFVNPTLKAMCAERGLFFHCVDLRWGINEEACQAGLVTLLCLREVDRSTHFVGLLKARYGWHLQPDAPPNDTGNALFRMNLDCAADDFPWVHEWDDRSVTEIEIRAGVLGGAARPGGAGPPASRLEAMRGRSLFYVAGPGLMRDAVSTGGAGEGPYAEQRLEALKGEIRAAGLPVAEYTDAQRLALAMRDALKAMLEQEYPLEKERPWLEAERAQHEAFAASRQRVFVRNAEDVAALHAYAAASGPEILVLHGEGGCGKSALLANWAREWNLSYPDDLVVVHFIGGSQSSSLLASVARRLSEEVQGRWPGAEAIDLHGTDAEVAARLSAFLAASAGWPFRTVLVLDGLDQLRGDPAVHSLAWLPPAAGPRLRILVSSLRGPTLDAAMARVHIAREIAPLTGPRRRRLVEGVLGEQGRALSDERLERIVGAEACRNALFLTVLLDELSNVSVHANLDADIDTFLACGVEPRDLFRLVLRRLASRHGAALARDVASAIACARHGMAEDELKALVGVDASGEPNEVTWSLFWHDFLGLVVCRDGPYAFFHRCTAEAAELEFGLAGEGAAERRAAVHARLGEFFAAQPASQRRAEEGPWALARGGPNLAERLAGILCDADVLGRLDDYELVELWLASGRSDEAASRYAESLRLGSEDADPEALNSAGNLLQTMGRAREGIPFLQEALRLSKKELGPEDAFVAQMMNNLALLLLTQGNYKESRPLFEEALQVYKKVLGPEDPLVAQTMRNLANLLKNQGDYAAARPMLEETLQIQKQALGPGHPYVANTIESLAMLLKDQGDYAAARPMYEEALEVQKRALGPEHPDFAGTMVNLANLLINQGDYAAARGLNEEALRIFKKALGPDHPKVASTIQSLAQVLHNQGDSAAARPMYEEVLRIRTTALGPEHTSVADAMLNLGALLSEQGDHAAARPMYEEALRVYKKAHGPEHPEVALAMQNLAALLDREGDYAAARPMYEEALRLQKKALGPEHPDVAQTMSNLARLLSIQGNSADAHTMFEAALQLRKKALGPEHPDVATTMHNLATLLEGKGDFAAARTMFEEALRIYKTALGPEHLEVAGTMTNLANLLREQEDYAAARSMYEEVLQVYKKVHGPEHPDVAQMMLTLGSLLQTKLDDHAAARPMYEEALRVYKKEVLQIYKKAPGLGPEHADTAWSMYCLGDLLSKLDAREALSEAASLLEAALAALERTQGPQHERTETVRGALEGVTAKLKGA